MKKLILFLCVASLLSVSGSTRAHRPQPTELERSLTELERVIDSLDEAYEKAIDSGGLPVAY